MLSRKRKIEIEETVVEFLHDYGIEKYPISIKEITSKLNIPLISYSSLDEHDVQLAIGISSDAFIVNNGDYSHTLIVYEDRGFSFGRTRFSCAHEILHIILEHSEEDPNTEKEADYGAGYLLVPHPLVLVASKDMNVSKRFGVSTQCALYALDQAAGRKREGSPWRSHERCLLENATWREDDLIARSQNGDYHRDFKRVVL